MAVSHIHSNTVPNWTGTVTVFNSQASTGTVAASALVGPEDWNSVHNQFLTLTGNTAGASTASGTNIVLAGGNNVTLSIAQAAGQATVSFGVGNYLTTAMASNRGSDFVQANAGFNGTNASGTIASNAISVSVAAQSVQPVAASAANGSAAFSTLSFSNANGVSFVTAAGPAVVASVKTDYALSDHSHGNPTLALTNLSGTTASNSAGFTLSLSAGAGGAGDGVNILAAGTQTAATTGTVLFQDSNGITFGMSNSSVITAAHNALTSQSNQAFSADASSTFQTLSFQDSNGVSFSNNAGALRVTHALQFTSATSAITSNALHSSASRVINIVAATNNAAGGTASLSSNVSFSAANGLTFYTSAGNAIVGSYTVPTVTNSSMTVSDAATSGTLARLAFTNLNGITLSLSTGAGGSHTIVGSYTVPTQTNQTLGLYAVGNTTGQSSSSTFDARTISFVGQGIASVGFSAGSVNISVPAGGGGITNVNISAGTTSQNLSNFVFSNSNGVSFGLNGSTITGSVAAGGGGGITASFYPPFPHPMATSSMVSGTTAATGGSSQTTAAFYLAPMVVDQDIHYNQVRLYASGGTAAGTGSWSAGHMVGLYTLNGGTAFSLDRTFVLNARLSQNSVTAHSMQVYWGTDSAANSTSWAGNSSASMTGWREALLHTGASTLTKGVYYIAVGFTHRTSGVSVGGINSVAFISLSQTTAAPLYGTNTAVPYLPRHIGSFTTTSNNTTTGFVVLPNSIHTSALTYTGGSSQYRWPIIHMVSS